MNHLRIAWLLVATPFYWHPTLAEFTRLIPQTTLFTGSWTKFALGYEDSFAVEVVGQRKIIRFSPTSTGYGVTFTYLSLKIIGCLLRFQPDVIFADGFCLWTVLALIIKVWKKWRIIIIYDGSSPSVDYKNYPLRLFLRRLIAKFADAFITNNRSGRDYLVEIIGAKEHMVFTQPYLVPDSQALLSNQESKNHELSALNLQRPIFLYVGQIIPRKGIKELLEAVSLLKSQGDCEFTLMIVGEGHEREQLEALSKNQGLETLVQWVGQVDYSQLGAYFKHADVFVFPTHEDVWGMVIPEAMALGKPILTSKSAGAASLVVAGQNGYCFEPHEPQTLGELMKEFIKNPQLAESMGSYSQQLISQYNPKNAADFLAKVTVFAVNN